MNLQYIEEGIEALAMSWENECIINGMSITIATNSIDDSRQWKQPPLVYKGASKELKALVNDFHSSTSTEAEVFYAWDFLLNFMQESAPMYGKYRLKSIHTEFNRVFPDYWFGTMDGHILSSAVQFLKLASLTPGRKLTVTKTRCMLQIGDKQIGLDRTGVFGVGRQFRTRLRLYDMHDPLTSSGAGYGRKPKNHKLNGAYRLLANNLPKRIVEFEVAFSIAVMCGLEVENLIMHRFDVYEVASPTKVSVKDTFAACHELIETSHNNPLRGLFELLKPVCKSRDFVSRFGNPHQQVSRRYSPEAKVKYRAALQALINGTVVKVDRVKDDKSKLMGLFGV